MTAPLSSADERLARWVREHARAVRGYVLALLRRPEDADDVLQDVFRKAWEARDRYEDRGQERAYLLRIADRLVCDRARKSGREVHLDTPGWQGVEPHAEETDVSALVAHEEWRQQLAGALEKLSDAQKRVLLLRYFGNLEFAVIAERMGSPLGTVLSHCRRGLAALRKILTET